MTIVLRAEVERVLKDWLKTEPTRSADDFVNDALAQAMGIGTDASELNRLLDEGLADTAAGRLMSSTEAIRRMTEWTGQHRNHG